MSGVYFSELNASKTQPDDEEVQQRIESMGSSLMHTYFGRNGYKTMAVGKILHSHVPDGSVDLSGGRDGWDRNEDANGNIIRSNWPPDLNNSTAETLTDWGLYVGENGTGTEADMSDSVSAAWAVDRLQETHTEPFMLMVGFLHPHVPWYAPQSYFDMYDPETLVMPPYKPDDWDDIPAAGLETINEGYPRTEWAIENNQWTNMVHAYLANVTFADSKVGLVLDALEASPYATNTIVVLWGDHGYHMGEKNTFQKHTLWDRSGVTPLIIKAPGMATNTVCDSVVSLLDLYPTLVDLAGLPPNDKVRGRTLSPLLENPALPWDHPVFTYKGGTEAVQYGNLRYIEYEDGSQELYDHTNDPDEWTNLVSNVDYAEILETLKNMSPFPPDSAHVFEFTDGSVWDDGAGGGDVGANQTLTNSVTGSRVTLTTVDIIGQDGSRASQGAGHRTNVGSDNALGIAADGLGQAFNFDSGGGWELVFDTDVYLQNIVLFDMNAGGTLTLSSSSFTDIVIRGAQDGANDLGDTFVPANTLISITFSHTGGLGVSGPKITSLSVQEASSTDFEFVNESAFDAAGTGASMTVGDVTLSTVDLIGQDGSRASAGDGHQTNIGNNDGLGIDSADSDQAVNFDSGEGWEFSFDTHAYLQEIDLLDMNAGGTLTISSPGFTDIVLNGELNGKQDLGSTFVPANTLIGITFSHINGQGEGGPRIMSLSMIPGDTNAPAIPTGLTAEAGDNLVSLDWDNGGAGLAYSVYRSAIPGSYGVALATGLTVSDYMDLSAENGTTYYYVVSATDNRGNESAQSAEVSATPKTDPDVLFADGFDGGFSPIWESTAFLSSTSYEGEKAAKMNHSDSVETGIDTTGYSGIRVTYARKINGLSSGSSFTSEWYDGTGWNTIESISNGFTSWEVVSRVVLPAGADDNPNLRLRFRVNAGSDFGYVDSVVVEGFPIALGYADWAEQQGLAAGVNDAYTDDPDEDGMVNLVEYAMGANSLVNDTAEFRPYVSSTQQNGTNYLNLIYRRRIDAAERGLDYQVGSSTNLVVPLTNGTEEARSGIFLDGGFEMITNRIPTDVESVQFMQLRIISE
ncbi:sulfatase [Pontiellaceae bacterium B12219]|nr:sulfatase [Pontiellaceae bacterium B12219]